MNMTVEQDDKLTRISLAGRMDLEGTRAIDQQFAFATSTQPLKLAVDLSNVSFVASIGLRTLLTAARAQAGRAAGWSWSRPTKWCARSWKPPA